MDAERPVQPALHDLVAAVHAPTAVLGAADGQIRAAGAQGLFHGDRRALSRAELRVAGHEPEPVTSAPAGPHGARFVGLVRQLGDPGPDPTVRVDRLREARPDGMVEDIVIRSTAAGPVSATVTIDLAFDGAGMSGIKAGVPVSTVDGQTVVEGEGAARRGDRLEWTVDVPPRGTVTLRWAVRVTGDRLAVAPARTPVEWSRPALVADDRRLVRLLDRSLDDLAALRLTEPDLPTDTFLGAGVPWYLTLFGRDCLWAARMLLPLGTGLADGTLRVLARRQGTRIDERTGEAPGKIMHELRYGAAFGVTADGPVTYYGTVDATPLWIGLLHDAWRWGLAEDRVVALLPNLEAALGWLDRYADPDGDGFLEYLDRTGRGLANQGWKDSADAVRYRDGRLADPPIALCEVQGYAYQAAVAGADLLDAFGRPGGDRWREYAADLAERFRARYWVDGPDGPYPALALDRDKRPVDALTSNIGHLLGTGLLDPAESALVAARLVGPELSGGYGLRTMSSRDGGFSPLSYHCGSVWPHDTAIVLGGLARAGFGAAAAVLAEGLLAAAESFGYRLPEVYGGDDRDAVGRPVPYPASCRPQAWSAAAAVAVLHAALGLDPDVPAGELRVRPLPGAPLGAIEARGLRLAGRPLDIRLDGTGGVTLVGVPEGIRVLTDGRPGGVHGPDTETS